MSKGIITLTPNDDLCKNVAYMLDKSAGNDGTRLPVLTWQVIAYTFLNEMQVNPEKYVPFPIFTVDDARDFARKDYSLPLPLLIIRNPRTINPETATWKELITYVTQHAREWTVADDKIVAYMPNPISWAEGDHHFSEVVKLSDNNGPIDALRRVVTRMVEARRV